MKTATDRSAPIRPFAWALRIIGRLAPERTLVTRLALEEVSDHLRRDLGLADGQLHRDVR